MRSGGIVRSDPEVTFLVLLPIFRQDFDFRLRRRFAFRRSVDAPPTGYVMPTALVSLPLPEGKPYPERHNEEDIEFNERLSA